MIGEQEVSIMTAMSIIFMMIFGLVVLNLYMLKKGVGLRD